MSRHPRFVPVLLVLLLVVPRAHATVGGPTTIDVLGWSAQDHRVFVHEIPRDEGGAFGRVLVYALDAPADAPPFEVPWTRGLHGADTAKDAEANRRVAELHDRLKPLIPRECPALPWSRQVVASDTLHTPLGDYARFRVLARFQVGDGFEVTTFRDPLVVVRDVRDIPGRPELLVVLAFIGDPEEGGYETQVPVIVRPGDHGPRPVEWRHVE